MHRAMPHLFVVLAVILQLPSASTAQQRSDVATPATTGKLVDLNGLKVHIYCVGHGRPPVVLIHGLGDYSFDWALVQPQVAGHAKACSYDRPAQAWSDPGPAPRGLTSSAGELHLLLQLSHVRAPYVLVGHSWGGLVARMYAHEFPREVAGIVLVDSAHEDEYLWINGKVIRPRFMTDEEWVELTKPRNISASTSAPGIPTGSPKRPRITKLPPPFDKLPAEAQKLRLWAMAQPFTKQRQDGGDTQDMRQDFIALYKLRTLSEHPLGSIPLIVLSKTPGVDDDEDYTADQLKWNRELQDQLATLSTNSEHLVAEHSGHHIQIEQPELVIASILRVVNARPHQLLTNQPQPGRHE